VKADQYATTGMQGWDTTVASAKLAVANSCNCFCDFHPVMPCPALSTLSCTVRLSCIQLFPAQLAGLALVLDRPELAADPRLLCSAARVCSSWRAAVAASGAGTTDVVLRFSTLSEHISNTLQDHMGMITSFAAWLSVHGSLVRSITLHGLADRTDPHGNSTSVAATASTACQMLGMALRLATAGALAAGSPVKLQVFTCDVTSYNYDSMPLLAALPEGLTKLHVTADECISRRERGLHSTKEPLVDAVAKLKYLRKLCINKGVLPWWILHPETLTAFTSLTCLELHHACSYEVGPSAWISAGVLQTITTGMTCIYVHMHAC
jgi:hypothetical protein